MHPGGWPRSAKQLDGVECARHAPAGERAAWREKKVRCLTTLGWVEVREQTWRAGTKTLRPLLAKLGVAARGYSRRLQRVLTDFGADETFAAAAAKVKEHYGLEVNSEQVRRVCLEHAERIAARVETKPLTTLAARGPDWIVAEADGTMLPIVDTTSAPPGTDRRKHRQTSWQETRVVAARALGQTTTHYDATLGDVAETGARWSTSSRSSPSPRLRL